MKRPLKDVEEISITIRSKEGSYDYLLDHFKFHIKLDFDIQLSFNSLRWSHLFPTTFNL